MKRDDIIQQKLFEAYKLSEFYLNLIVDDNYNHNNFTKGSQEETPFQLSKAFSTKLYQIISRYDTLLEQNEFEQKALTISTPTSTKKKYNFPVGNFDDSDESDSDEFSCSTRNSDKLKHFELQQQQQQQQKKITKSFSNLSKDSGMVLDLSHNSDSHSFANSNDALSNITSSFISEQLSEEDNDEDVYNESITNLNDTLSSLVTISSINVASNNQYSSFNWYLKDISPSSKLLCDDNDSLMDVSMIENIEAVYKTSTDKNDSMNSSILTFI
jgi:hypothetical protein